MGDEQNRPPGQLADRGAAQEVAGRLHEAVRAAGGNLAVARRAGVPLGTLSNYVRGRNGMKIEPLSALAVACNVSLDWLVSGTEASQTRLLINPDFPVAAAAPPPGLGEAPAKSLLAGMSGGIDVRVLAKAIEIVAAIAGAAEFQQDPKGLARRIATTYAVLIEPDASRE
jgi:transcriptional regulator with XRE-family HTH domain